MTTRNRWHTRPNNPAAQQRAKQYASSQHRALRKAARTHIDQGKGTCWRCGGHIKPYAKFHLGHSDDRTHYEGPEHPACNLKAAAKAGRAKQRRGQVRRAQSRNWGDDFGPCPVCSKPVRSFGARCCSHLCATKWRETNWHPNKPRQTERSTPPQITCGWCMVAFTPPDRRPRAYCSSLCRIRASNARATGGGVNTQDEACA